MRFADVAAACAPKEGWAQGFYLTGPDLLRTRTPLDALLGGGLSPGVTVLGGESSAGKSTIACNVAANVIEDGGRVLYLTLDDSWGTLASHVIGSWSLSAQAASMGVEPFRWSGLQRRGEELRRRMGDTDPGEFMLWLRAHGSDPVVAAADAFERAVGDRLAVVDSMGTADEACRVLDALSEAGEVPDLVVVDYVQLYASGDAEADRQQVSRIDAVMERLKRASLMRGMPLLAISPTRRLSASDRKDGPSLDWLLGSTRIGYASWAAVIAWRPEGYGEGPGGEWREVQLWCAKNKSGRRDFGRDARVYGAWGAIREADGS